MKSQFDPLQAQAGEFRVALCLTQLGERAFEVLKLAESLEFTSPRFVGDAYGEIWAIVLQQLHSYDGDPFAIVDPWDAQMSDLWKACEPNAELKMVISHNFRAYVEMDAA